MSEESIKPTKSLNVFCIYAEEDSELYNELTKHLRALIQLSVIHWYEYRATRYGSKPSSYPNYGINISDIILLLISPDFMASDFAYGTVLRKVLQRHERGAVRVVPIILRPVDWQDAPFAHLQVLPSRGRAVTLWNNRDDVFAFIANYIRRLSEERLLEHIASLPLDPLKSTPVADDTVPSGGNPYSSFPPQYRTSDVFVKSGFPEITFVARSDFVFLKLALEQPGRGIVVEGPSGIGKTTAVEKAVADLKKTSSKSHPSIQRILSARNPAHRQELQTLRQWHNGTVIIDDFHRLDAALRNDLVDYLKELADTAAQTQKIAIVGIPRTGQSLVKTSFDIATRLDIFALDRVDDKLIQQMIEKGEQALNIHFDRKSEIVLVANGSFNLAQFMCFSLCALAGIEQTQEQTRVVRCDIATAIEHVMSVLGQKFRESIKRFIAMGEPRDVTALRLLEELAIAEDGYLLLPQLQASKPDLAPGIERFIKERWIEQLYQAYPDSTNLLYFDELRQALVIDDPQLAFYLKQVRFSALAKEAGKLPALTQRKVFISYSHKDARWLERLRVHLRPVEREGIIDLWDDTKIAAGILWKDAIANALETASVAVLLISADFLASDFIAEHEMPTILARAKAGGTTVIPVILSPSLFDHTALGAFQSINASNNPVCDMTHSQQEQVFVKVAQTVMQRFKAG